MDFPRAGSSRSAPFPSRPVHRAMRYTVKALLVLVVVVTILPVLVAIPFHVMNLFQRDRAALDQSLRLTTRALLQSVDGNLRAAQNDLELLAGSEELTRGDLAQFHKRGNDMVDLGIAYNVVVLDETGQQLINTLKPPGEPLPKTGNMERLRRVFETGKPVYSDLFLGGASKRLVVDIGVPVSRNGKVIYDLTAAFRPEKLAKIFDEQHLPPGYVAEILDRSGTVVARSSQSEKHVGKKTASPLLRAMAESSEGTLQTEDLDNVASYVSYTRSAVTGWTVAIAVPRELLLGETKQYLLTLSAGALLVLVVGVMLGARVAQHIAQSINALIPSALALGEGRPMEPPRSAIAEVMSVVDALVRVEAELDSHRSHLEELVSSRTAELALARDAAEAANKAKSIFLAKMSHELRTPLNAILGFSSILGRDAGLSESQKETLSIIHKSGDHLLRLINDVLDIAKIEAGRITVQAAAFDLGGMILDVTDMLRMRAEERGIQLTLAQASGFPRCIIGDEARLRQVLINLLSNAINATEQGGVTLRLGLKGNHGEHLLLEVEDTGCGIDPEDQSRLMQPFVQVGAQSKQQGTGLGLAISRQFVELMGGSLTLTSTPGHGSSFRVELPVRLAQPDAIPPAPSVRGEVTGLEAGQAHCRVLVADDQEDNRLLLQRLLESAGFEVQLAENGAVAVDRFRIWRPQFIWMDRQMPVMDGVEATRRIRALPDGDKVRIAAVTASTFRDEREEMMVAGFDDIVYKPFRSGQIFDCMEPLLGLRFVREAEAEAVPVAPPDGGTAAAAPVSQGYRNDLLQALHELRPVLENRMLVPRELMNVLKRLKETDAPGMQVARLVARIDAFDHEGALRGLAEIEALLTPADGG